MTVVSPLPARTVDGWDAVTLAPTSTPAADSWTFTVLTGNAVLTGSGGTRTFDAPASFDGTTVRIGIQATSAGVTSAQQVAVYTVKPWNSFILTGQGGDVGTIDGGTVAAPAVNILDGGTLTSPAVDVIDGGAAGTGVSWIPRRPLQLI